MRTTRKARLSVGAVVAGLLVSALSAAHAVGSGTVEPPPRIAFVARADNPADALAVGPIAGKYGAPLYTTWPHEFVPEAKAGLQGFNPDIVIIAGGDAAIHPSTMQAIKNALPGAEVIRVFGEGRNETAQKVAALIDDYSPAYLPVDATALDADLLDGKDSTAFARSGQACKAGEIVTGIDASGVPSCAADKIDGGNASSVDGIDSDQLQIPDTLPAGRTLTGLYFLDTEGTGSGEHGSEISFPIPLAQDPDGWIMYPGDPATVECPGSFDAPSAAPGNFCLYITSASGWATDNGAVGAAGAVLFFSDDGTAGDLFVLASWAVTAHNDAAAASRTTSSADSTRGDMEPLSEWKKQE